MAEVAAPTYRRLIGSLRGSEAGPSLIVVGGIHGNEPAGVRAAERVLARLGAMRLRGDFVALAGNVRALRLGCRYQRRDLNRQWSARALLPAPADGDPDDAERLEQAELRAALDEAVARARGPVAFLDLHTTSADGIPFVMVGDTIRHRAFADAFPLPLILGLEEQLDGVLSEYMTAKGCVTLACEGGQHASPAAAENLEALLWLAVSAAGLVDARDVPQHAASFAHLDRARHGLPRIIEVLFRHAVVPEDAFVMEPGFANIAPVRRGQLVARDRRGELRAPSDGLVLLPLYQSLGADGFFFGRPVGRLAKEVAVLARRLHLDRLLPLMPGIRPQGDELALDRQAADRYPMSLFRLFGFRRAIATDGGALRLRRR
jgi:succinylglutamate desuccinylase